MTALDVHGTDGRTWSTQLPRRGDEPDDAPGLRVQLLDGDPDSPIESRLQVAWDEDPKWRDLLGGAGDRAFEPTGLSKVAVELRCPDGPLGALAATITIGGDGRISTHWSDPVATEGAATSVPDVSGKVPSIIVEAPYREVLSWLLCGRRLGELVAAGQVRIHNIPLASYVSAVLSSDPRDRAAPRVDPSPLLVLASLDGLVELLDQAPQVHTTNQKEK